MIGRSAAGCPTARQSTARCSGESARTIGPVTVHRGYTANSLTREKAVSDARLARDTWEARPSRLGCACGHAASLGANFAQRRHPRWAFGDTKPKLPSISLTALQFGARTAHPGESRRAAAALGRIGDPKAIPAILAALAITRNDRALDHALTYALIEIGDAKATRGGAGASHRHASEARLLAALENIPESGLDAKDVLAELDSPDAALRETAWWIAGRHPQWGGELAGYFREKLKVADGAQDRGSRTSSPTDSSSSPAIAAVQKLIGEAAYDMQEQRLEPLMLHVMARSGLKALPEAWHAGILGAMVSGDEAINRLGFATLARFPSSRRCSGNSPMSRSSCATEASGSLGRTK